MRDHPVIEKMERDGYLYEETSPECPECTGDLGDEVYEIDGKWVCCECFKDWVKSKVDEAPEQFAKLLSVPTQSLNVVFI